MKNMLPVAAIALAFAVPSLAAQAFEVKPITSDEFNGAWAAAHGDPEIADSLEWQALVARTNADRLAAEKGDAQATEKGAPQANNAMQSAGSVGTDAMPGSIGTSPGKRDDRGYWETGRYRSALAVKQDR